MKFDRALPARLGGRAQRHVSPGMRCSGGESDGLRRRDQAVRFVFSPPTEEAAGLLSLPWSEPLEQWHDPRLVEIRQRGISRHIVRFVADDGELYALKAINENLARREYRLLRELAE